ncbi:hypothetical protein Tsp_00535 [Trichinella spiralis]|uniref:hypothetical protein n=1 Tax=Trichinella spiralis TaxID=6334 RepID=UPI0001EFBC6C|nr:hypothetical protein Tsp_00535 [Trichinella spiralis]
MLGFENIALSDQRLQCRLRYLQNWFISCAQKLLPIFSYYCCCHRSFIKMHKFKASCNDSLIRRYHVRFSSKGTGFTVPTIFTPRLVLDVVLQALWCSSYSCGASWWCLMMFLSCRSVFFVF